jgi:hypothetical protein
MPSGLKLGFSKRAKWLIVPQVRTKGSNTATFTVAISTSFGPSWS